MRLTAKADAAIVLIAVAAIIILKVLAGGEGGEIIIVHGDEEIHIAMASLPQEQEYVFECEGGEVVVAVGPDGAHFKSSPCKDKLCVACGMLSNAGDCAVCAPCGVCVYITGGGADGVTG